MPADVQDILRRFRALKEARGFKFAAPSDKKDLGQFAFAPGVVETILTGVAVSLLRELVVFLFQQAKDRVHKSDETPASVIKKLQSDSKAIKEGIEKLKTQLIRHEDAVTAVELLQEALIMNVEATAALPQERKQPEDYAS